MRSCSIRDSGLPTKAMFTIVILIVSVASLAAPPGPAGDAAAAEAKRNQQWSAMLSRICAADPAKQAKAEACGLLTELWVSIYPLFFFYRHD